MSERVLVTNKMEMLVVRVLGILVIIGGLIFTIHITVENGRMDSEKNNYVQCSAVIKSFIMLPDQAENVGMHYRANVTYNVNGKEYDARVYLADGSLKKGDTVNVYYNPDNPSELAELSNTQNRLEYMVDGIIAVLVGIILVLISLISVDQNFIMFAGIPIKSR